MLKQIVQSAVAPTDEISLFVNCFYLDQNFSFLLDHLSAVENLRNINPDISELEWRNLLGQLRLRGEKGTYPLAQLSGGEKLKVALLGLSHAETMPELYYWMNQKIIWILNQESYLQMLFLAMKVLCY